MNKRKSFGKVSCCTTESEGVTISVAENGDYVMGDYALRPISHGRQMTTHLHLEVVAALGEEEIVRAVYEVRELTAGHWKPCRTPYVAPFCFRADVFVSMQAAMRRRENPLAKIIHAEFFAEYIA
jgi:hypothetical protein